MAPPTLIFVPGSWHIPATWSKVTALLPQYKCICVELPSTTSDTTKGLTADITAVRTVIAAETSAGNNVIVVVHSYGGAVGSSAIQGFTQPKEGSAEAGNGVVLGMVFIVTWFHPTGMSFMDALGGKAPEPPLWTMDTEKGLVVLAVDPRELFYHDLPVEEGDDCVKKLREQSLFAHTERSALAYSGWLDVPVWYLATSEDKVFPFEVQKMLVEMARGAGADVTVEEIASSHSPMLSRPEETTAFIKKAVGVFEKKEV